MPINSAYQEAIDAEEGKFTGESKFEALPFININVVGDKFKGTLVEKSPIRTRKVARGGKDVDVKYQVFTFKDVTVISTDMTDDGPVKKTEKFEKASLFAEKKGMFAAIGRGLAELGGDVEEPVDGHTWLFKRITDGTAPTLRDGSTGSKPHRYAVEFKA